MGCAVVQVDPSQNGERANKPVRADTSPTLGLGVCFFGGFFGFVGFLSRQPKKNREKKGALRCAFLSFFFLGVAVCKYGPLQCVNLFVSLFGGIFF